MEYRFYRLKIFARVLALFISLLITSYSVISGQRYVTSIVFTLLVIVQLLELFRFLDRSNREIAAFVEQVSSGENSDRLPVIKSSSDFTRLRTVLGGLIDDLRNTRMEAEKQYQYLDFIVSEIQTGLICTGNDGRIVLSNPEFDKFTGMKASNISALKDSNQRLYQFIRNAKAGDRQLIHARSHGKPVQLSLHLTEFRMNGENFRLCRIQDIKTELEERESESWQKLIRVMTHEIMNSVTPIHSLSRAIVDELEELNGDIGQNNATESLKDITESAATICDRSEGLMHFINTFRAVSKISRPVPEKTGLRELLEHTFSFLKKELIDKNIQASYIFTEEDYMVMVDREMITRVLINLLRNAIEAAPDDGASEIIVRVSGPSDKPLVEIHDNGLGIQPENLSEIFIPFFTTKKNGSGIGLSICREIMRLHHGSVYAVSDPASGTSFFLEF